MQKGEDTIVTPTVEGLKKDGVDYSGIIFIGLMNVNGNPSVIEYNVRMGDPETEVVIPRLKSDLLELLDATAKGSLSSVEISIEERAASTVMLVAGGYPEAYEKGKVISGLDKVENVIPFHAGTKEENGQVVTNGGRVIALSALGTDLADALTKSKVAASVVNWDKRYYRTDIGFDIVEAPAKINNITE